jgi:glycosyltransferase involved in cell wall biosynthesis
MSMTLETVNVTNDKIRVLRIINRFNLGGPTYNAVFLTRYLSDDFETLLVGGMPEEGEIDSLHILSEYGIEPLMVQEMRRKPRFRHDRAAYVRLKSIIRDFKPHIVHTHASKAGALGRRAAFNMKVPVVVHTFHGHVFHSYFGKLKTQIYKAIERSLAARSSGIIAISEKQKKELALEHGICISEKIKVIPLGFDLQKFKDSKKKYRQSTRLEYGLHENEIAVAIVGRLVPVKNHRMFLESVIKVSERITHPVSFFIVGDGPEKEFLLGEIARMNLPENIKIHMTSWIMNIAVFNAGMDIVCLTSNNEGTPVSLIEAQAAGIPVISTDVGGVRDIVEESVTGYIVPKSDSNAFAEKLCILIEDKNNRENMSQKGWSFVESKFHYTRLVKDMENYYKDLVDKTKLQ